MSENEVEQEVVEAEITEVEDVVEEETNEQFFSTISSGEKAKHYTEEEHGFDLTVKFRLPNRKHKNTAEIVYSKIYNKMLQDDDHMTTNQLLETVKKRNLWTEEDEVRLTTIDASIIEARDASVEEKSKKKKAVLEAELATLREEKFRLAIRVGQITGTSIEVMAEQEKTSYMLCNRIDCINDDGEEELLFPTRDKLDDEQDLKMLETIIMDAKSFWTGEGLSDFLHLGD